MNGIAATERAYRKLLKMLLNTGVRTPFEALHEPWLLAHGVVGLSFGQRMTDRGRTGEPVLIVYVRVKESLNPESPHAIPRQIKLDGRTSVSVDVRVQAEASASMEQVGSVRRQNQVLYGRVATWVRKGAKEYLLTCQHVLQQQAKRIEVLRGLSQGVKQWQDVGQSVLLATLATHQTNVQLEPDQGLFLPDKLQIASAARWPRYARVSSAPLVKDSVLHMRLGRQVAARARVIDPQTTERIFINDLPYRFRDLIKTSLVTIKGDSGSPVEDADGNLVGYVIADTSHLPANSANFTLVQPIAPVLVSLGCSLPPLSSDPAYVSALLAATNLPNSQATPINTVPLAPDVRDVDVLARTLWGVAGSDGTNEMAAVAHVVRNRLVQTGFGNDVDAICRKRNVFPCWTDSAVRKVNESDPQFRRALAIAYATLSGAAGPDPTLGATHQHRVGEPVPRLRKNAEPVVQIGNRIFYRKFP